MEIALIDDLYRKIKISDKDFNPTITPEGRGGKNERVSTHQENSKQLTQHLLPQMMPKLIWVVHDSKIDLTDPKTKEEISVD